MFVLIIVRKKGQSLCPCLIAIKMWDILNHYIPDHRRNIASGEGNQEIQGQQKFNPSLWESETWTCM